MTPVGALSSRERPNGPTLSSADLTLCVELPQLSPSAVVAIFLEVLRQAGATIVNTLSHDFADAGARDGAGLTCVAILAESHAVLHTWPETATVNVDIFSCTTRLSGQAVIDELARRFGATHVDTRETSRTDGHRDARRVG